MNKTQKIYIVLTVFVMLSSYTASGDILDSYIGKLMAKSDFGEDKLLALLDKSKSKVKPSSEKNDNNKAQPTKVTGSSQAVKVKDASGQKQASDIEKAGSATLDKTRQLREKLKNSSITSLSGVGSSSIDSQLKDVLLQLKSLSFSEESKTTQQETVPLVEAKKDVIKSDLKADSVKTVESVSLSKEKQPRVVLPENTSDIVDMFELAESLFHIGDKVKALKYYRKAFETSLPVTKNANPKRAWILFQIGNCLYNVDNLEAIKIYDQLIVEHPGSDWTNCARTKKQVLKWLLVEKPMTLIMTEVK